MNNVIVNDSRCSNMSTILTVVHSNDCYDSQQCRIYFSELLMLTHINDWRGLFFELPYLTIDCTRSQRNAVMLSAWETSQWLTRFSFEVYFTAVLNLKLLSFILFQVVLSHTFHDWKSMQKVPAQVSSVEWSFVREYLDITQSLHSFRNRLNVWTT